MAELNPNHPVTQMTHDNWHKIVGVIMLKFDVTDVEILAEDVARIGDNDKAVVADCRGGKFVIRVMNQKQAAALARKEGGLPV
jgi:hypothetical protein